MWVDPIVWGALRACTSPSVKKVVKWLKTLIVFMQSKQSPIAVPAGGFDTCRWGHPLWAQESIGQGWTPDCKETGHEQNSCHWKNLQLHGPESLPPHNVLSKSSTHPNIDKQKEVPLDVHLSPRRRSQHPKLHCANPCPETTLMLLGQSGDLNCQPDMRGRHEWCKLLSNRWAVKIMYFNINARSVIPKTDELWAIAEAKTSWLG